MGTRKFYRSTITLVVLSDRPIDDEGTTLESILAECDTGDMVMKSMDTSSTAINRAAIDAELILAGSDPEFFPLDDDDEAEA